VDCGPIPEVVGYVFFNTTADTHWPVAIDTACATGHEGSNVTNLTCQLDATWTEVQGCTLVDCGVAEVGEGYELSGQGDTTYGASQALSCASGYQGQPDAITCQENGLWSMSSGCDAVPASSSANSQIFFSAAQQPGIVKLAAVTVLFGAANNV